MTVNSSEKFGVADSMAMDTGHGDEMPLLTQDDIVRRAQERLHSKPIKLTPGIRILGWLVGFALGGAIALYAWDCLLKALPGLR